MRLFYLPGIEKPEHVRKKHDLFQPIKIMFKNTYCRAWAE